MMKAITGLREEIRGWRRSQASNAIKYREKAPNM
jgi:hypothetical protein